MIADRPDRAGFEAVFEVLRTEAVKPAGDAGGMPVVIRRWRPCLVLLAVAMVCYALFGFVAHVLESGA